jgi:hypothetical protein
LEHPLDGLVYVAVYRVDSTWLTFVGFETEDANPAGLDVQLIAGITDGVPVSVTLSIAQYRPRFDPQ